MNPASAQKRIAFGYNRNYDIELNPGPRAGGMRLADFFVLRRGQKSRRNQGYFGRDEHSVAAK